jgi:glycosyltransferase involved in cell wall biosynthesis
MNGTPSEPVPTEGAVRPVRVVIDAQSLSSEAAGSGIATYTEQLMGALSDRSDVAVTALCTNAIVLPAGVTRARIHRLLEDPRLEQREHLTRLPLDLWWARRGGAVFHNPVFHAPPAVRRPWVQTLHDVVPLVAFSPDVAVLTDRWKRFGPRYRKASAVIAISQHAATEGIRVLGLDPQRVHVARHGIDPRFRPGDQGPADPPYVLMVNEYSQRKGYGEAFAVFDALVEAGLPHRLVVVGRIRDWARPDFEKVLATSHHRERIDLLEWVPDLAPIYQGAAAFLMTSRYEGFGFTPLEAMASGVPVVAFSNSAVTEVVDGGGQLVPDGDVPAMVAVLRRLLVDPSWAGEWSQRGLAHAATFTWAASAAVHAEVYRSVAEES